MAKAAELLIYEEGSRAPGNRTPLVKVVITKLYNNNFFFNLFWGSLGTHWIAINLSPQLHPKPQLLMNLLRQKVSFLIKLFLKKPSERRRRILTDGHVVLYECTALTSWATGPFKLILFLLVNWNKFKIRISYPGRNCHSCLILSTSQLVCWLICKAAMYCSDFCIHN